MSRNDDRLTSACTGMGETARQILDWIDDNGSFMAAERVALLHEVYRTETAATALARATTEEPCIAFVGPPRSGKTQLISSIIERNGGALSVRFDGIREQVAYLKQISPDGAKHGSAAIIRLTARTTSGAQNFPVAVRLLSCADVVKVLGAAFMSGAERSDLEPSMAMIDRLVADARNRASSDAVVGMTEEDIWDIRHYFTARFGEEPLIRALLTGGYWERLTELVPRLQNAERARILSVLWGGLAPMTDVFVSLTDALANLGYGRDARCALDSLLGLDSRTGRFQRRTDNILNAQTMLGLGRPDDQTVVVCSAFGQWVSIPRSVLSAIVAEVRLAVATSSADVLEKADLLEFPSIDSTSGTGNLVRSIHKDPAGLGALFMSAKTVFLFERYIEEQAITCLVVCVETNPSKVGALAGLIGSWVDKSHGAEPAVRENQTNGLFLCFTKLDRDFAEPGRRVRDRRPDWSKRIAATLTDGFGKNHSWPKEWTTTRGFDNIHLVRNPAHRAKSLLNYANDGRELGFKPEQKDRLDVLGRDFAANDEIRNHVSDPVTIWREAFELNDGGITLLAQSIADVCDARAKSRHVLNGLNGLGTSLRDRLRRYHVAPDRALQCDRRSMAALTVTRRLRRCAEERRMGHLVRALQLTDTEFNDVLLRAESGTAVPKTMSESQVNGASIGAAGVRNFHLEKATTELNSRGDTPAPPEIEALARRYANALISHWVASARLFAQADRICQTLHMPRSSLLQLVDELIAGAVRLDLEGRITQQLQPVLAAVDNPADRIARAALCGANIISDYVMWLGFNDSKSNNHPRRKGRNSTPIFPPRAALDVWAESDAPEQAFDYVFLNDWSQAFLSLVTDNADDLAGRSIDPERNNKLGDLLAKLEINL